MQINKVLITNDDGFNSFGIKLLSDILKQFAYEIYVVAPRNNRSGASRSISLKREIKFEKITSVSWVVDGTPTDCVIFALNYIFKNDKPDYIFSGINAGTNIGDEISYSGTVGAAFEGALRGVPSLAISQKITNTNNNFTISKINLPNILPQVFKYFSNENLLLNLNFPNCKQEDLKGLKIVNCSDQKHSDEIIVDKNESNFRIGKMYISKIKNVDDLNALKKNYITLSSLLINLTNKTFTDNYEL